MTRGVKVRRRPCIWPVWARPWSLCSRHRMLGACPFMATVDHTSFCSRTCWSNIAGHLHEILAKLVFLAVMAGFLHDVCQWRARARVCVCMCVCVCVCVCVCFQYIPLLGGSVLFIKRFVLSEESANKPSLVLNKTENLIPKTLLSIHICIFGLLHASPTIGTASCQRVHATFTAVSSISPARSLGLLAQLSQPLTRRYSQVWARVITQADFRFVSLLRCL